MKRFTSTVALLVLSAGCAEEATPESPAGSGTPPISRPASNSNPRMVNTPATVNRPGQNAQPAPSSTPSLAEARRGFVTKPGGQQLPVEAVPQPPSEVFRLVKFRSPVGELSAYLTPDPGDGVKRPAIVWITGGDCNSIGDVWKPAPGKTTRPPPPIARTGSS